MDRPFADYALPTTAVECAESLAAHGKLYGSTSDVIRRVWRYMRACNIRIERGDSARIIRYLRSDDCGAVEVARCGVGWHVWINYQPLNWKTEPE